jgi:16S rRNA (cytosine967-C5)-methyltransferase
VLEALESILDQKRPADAILDRTLRKNRDLSSEERAAVARRTLGTCCLRGRLDWLLEAQCSLKATHATRLAAYLITEEKRGLDVACLEAGLPLDPKLARLDIERAPWPCDPAEHLAAKNSLPIWIAKLWREELGDEGADRLAAVSSLPGPITLRTNTLKIDREELARALASEGVEAKPTPLSPLGLIVSGRPNLFGLRAWRGGLFEVQDEGSQLVALLASPEPGQRCIDFCAGAGGKTLAMAAAMKDQGELLALDINSRRLADLKPRLARAGIRNVRALAISSQGPLPAEATEAQVVLVDAPCSSLGTLRRSPDARWRADPEITAQLPELQLEILRRAGTCVRRGGRLIYATCTINQRENEEVALRFSEEHPKMAVQPIAEILNPGLATALGSVRELKLLPHVHGTDGFFACAWKRL